MRRKAKLILTCIIILLVCVNNMQSQSFKKEKCVAGKITSSTVTSAKLNINNISTIVFNNGVTDETAVGDAGFVFPKGSGKVLCYVSGLVWGGNIDDYWAVGGSAYRTGLVQGRILPNGNAEDINLPHVRIYRVRSDYKNFTTAATEEILFAAEIADEGKSADEIYSQYDLDWSQWPAQYGAPYIDKDGDGVYNPNIDIPGMSEEPCQTIWYVANDLDASKTQYMYGALPLKIEMQATFWAYKADKPIGNTVFRKYKIINRNSKSIEQMYVSLWSDPEVGAAFDDYTGCDTTLNLGFAYNGRTTDESYGSTPPALGFSILQGPIIPGSYNDSARYNDKWQKGKKNLGMTAFFMHTCGADANWSDPAQGNYTTGALVWRNLFEGKLARDGIPYTDPNTGRQTKFALSGDPVTNTGWLDGSDWGCGDRRMGSVSGPFTMNAGDTQEVVFAQTAAGGTQGVDRLGAVSLLKHYIRSIKVFYDNGPYLSTPPPAPIIKASEFDNSIILSWSETGAFEAAENFSKGGISFEGYNVYQLPSATSSISEGIRLATYDLMNGVMTIVTPEVDAATGVLVNRITAYGTDSGISRYIKITEDKLRGISSLYNGSNYYFAITSYGYSSDPGVIPNCIESLPNIIAVIPQTSAPGIRYEGSFGQTLNVAHTNGIGNGTVSAVVADPLRVTGHNYRLEFQKNWYRQVGGNWIPITDTTGVTPKKFQNEWFVKDLNTSTYVLSNQTVYDNYDISKTPAFNVGNGTAIADGLKINVSGSFDTPSTFSGINLNGTPLNDSSEDWTSADGKWRFTSGKYWGYGATSRTCNLGWPGFGGTTTEELQDDFELRWTGVKGTQTIGGVVREITISGGSMATYYNVPEGLASFPLNPSPGTNANFLVRVPFEVWNATTGQQITCIVRKRENAGNWQAWNTNNGGRMYMDVVNIPYSETTVLNEANGNIWKPKLTWWLGTHRTAYTLGDVTRILITNPLIPGTDKYEYTAPAVTTNTDLAKEDINAINVFPNPYYCINILGDGNTENRITFTHLPQNARIKIFNIAGQFIRLIEKTDHSQFARWDLKTDGFYDAPTGIYAAHIDLPDLGKVKIVKFAIIREQRTQVGN